MTISGCQISSMHPSAPVITIMRGNEGPTIKILTGEGITHEQWVAALKVSVSGREEVVEVQRGVRKSAMEMWAETLLHKFTSSSKKLKGSQEELEKAKRELGDVREGVSASLLCLEQISEHFVSMTRKLEERDAALRDVSERAESLEKQLTLLRSTPTAVSEDFQESPEGIQRVPSTSSLDEGLSDSSDRRNSEGSSPPPPIRPDPGATHEGSLWKRGGFPAKWRRYWFVLEGSDLSYFHMLSEGTLVRHKTLDVSRYVVTPAGGSGGRTHPFCFRLQLVKRNKKDDARSSYLLSAETDAEMHSWKLQLEMVSAARL